MTGIDGELALLQMVWADLSVNSKNTTAKSVKDEALSIVEAYVNKFESTMAKATAQRAYLYA